jgi:hypothetical protein
MLDIAWFCGILRQMTPIMQILSLLLVVCGILLVWGCSTSAVRLPLTDTPATPTLVTFSPALGYSFPQYEPFSPRFFAFSGLNRLQSSPFSLSSPPPTCYPQPQGGSVCLGTIVNNTLATVQNLGVLVRLGNQELRVTPEQHTISQGSFAPYRARFEVRSLQPSSATITSYQVNEATIAPMELAQEDGQYFPGRGYGIYRYSANVLVGERDAKDIRLTVTLFDEAQQVVAYRTQDLPPLAAHSTTPIEVSLIPQAFAEQFSVIATLTLR